MAVKKRKRGRTICFPWHWVPLSSTSSGVTRNYLSFLVIFLTTQHKILPLSHISLLVCCVCVCVCIWDTGLFKERRWWHLCHLGPLFSLWGMVPLITISIDTVCRSGGIIILYFFNGVLYSCLWGSYFSQFLHSFVGNQVFLLKLFSPSGVILVTDWLTFLYCVMKCNYPYFSASPELTIDVEYILSTAGP